MSIRTLLKHERKFLSCLSSNERHLLGSFFFWALSQPFHGVFVNTYLWRASQDPVVLFVYNAAFFAGVAGGFVLNALLTRRYSVLSMLIVGSLLQIILPALLVSLGLSVVSAVMPIGLAMGAAAGLYWANRNFLTSQATDTSHRMSYLSLEYVFSAIAGIVAPLIIGWFLALGEITGWYSVSLAYHVSALVSAILLFVSIAFASKLDIGSGNLHVRHWFVRSASPAWNRFRAFAVCDGMVYGAEAAIPLLLILRFIGQEEAVGTFGALTFALSAFALYVVGRQISNHLRVFQVWLAFTLVGVSAVAYSFTLSGVVLYLLLKGIIASFKGSSLAALLFDAVSNELQGKEERRAAHILDRELFLNGGRLLVLVPFILIGDVVPDSILRYGLFFVVFAQILMLLLMNKRSSK